MSFQPGNNANPGGRPKDKIFTDALRLVLKEEVDDPDDKTKKIQKVRVIANRLVAEAMAGESWAIQQVMDRIEGKPSQSITGDADEPLIVKVVKFTDA